MLILLEHALQVSVLESTLMNAQTSTKNVLEVLASQLRALKITLKQFAPRWFVEQMALVQTVQPMTPP
jgi:N-formylglutamate amidohydrolase